MQKNTRFKIITGSCLAIFMALFFYFGYWQNLNKKIVLNFSGNAERDDAKNEKEIIAQEEKARDTENKNNANIQAPVEKIKDAKNTENTEIKIINHLVDWGFKKTEARKIDTIIIHSSYDAVGNEPYSVSGVIAEYKSYGVSPHYLIDRKGKIYRFVEDKNIAYHAGESKMPDGRTGVNNFSIGIEMLTTKKDKLTDEQYNALNSLIKNLKEKYKITAVLGHNQIAPSRKDDPWNFEWGKIK